MNATVVNPWIGLFLTTVGILLAWVLTPSSWPLPYAVNAMYVCMLVALGEWSGC